MDVGLLVNANLLLLAAHCLESPSNILLVENLLEGVGSLVLMMNSLGVFCQMAYYAYPFCPTAHMFTTFGHTFVVCIYLYMQYTSHSD
jgi:hypothetical protein